MSRILVTGAAGYIGSVLVPMLLEAGHEVIAVDNLMYGQDQIKNQKNLIFIKADVRDEQLMESIFDEHWLITHVIPLAAIVGAKACDNDPATAISTNFNAIKLVLGRWSPKIIFPNTNSGYGVGQKNTFCTEESPLNPISLYGRTKVEAEKLVIKNRNSIVLRLATVFGMSPRPRLDLLVNDLTYQAVTKGSVEIYESHFKRNYIHVKDVARAFIHCIDNFENMEGNIYNLGLSDANLSKWELCEEIKKQVPQFQFSEGTGEDPDKRNYMVSNAKIEATGFKPLYSLEYGIAELIRGFQTIKDSPKFRNA